MKPIKLNMDFFDDNDKKIVNNYKSNPILKKQNNNKKDGSGVVDKDKIKKMEINRKYNADRFDKLKNYIIECPFCLRDINLVRFNRHLSNKYCVDAQNQIKDVNPDSYLKLYNKMKVSIKNHQNKYNNLKDENDKYNNDFNNKLKQTNNLYENVSFVKQPDIIVDKIKEMEQNRINSLKFGGSINRRFR